jgi:hypothetical protein
MQTLPVPSKNVKAFYAHLFMDSGALVKVQGTLYFVGDDSTIVEVEPGMVNFLTVLGEMTLADAQRIEDLMTGGSAAVACGRDEGRQ